MKITFSAIVAFFLCSFGSYADEPIPPLVGQQFKQDITSFIHSRSNSITKEQLEAVDSLYAEAISTSPSIFQFSKEEIATLSSGQALYSEKQILDSYTELKTRLHGRPAPAIVDFYKQLLDQKTLDPVQSAICYRFIRHVMPPEAEN